MSMNEEIDAPEVRLIDEDNQQLGIVKLQEALARAKEAELDLVEISPSATPPVCRIMDFGKFKYQAQKKEHDQKRKHHGVEMKQIRIKTFRIDMHDVGIKLKQAKKFLEAGHRLLFTMMFRAREHNHSDIGAELLVKEFANPLAYIAKLDSQPRKEGKKMTMSLSPLPNFKQIAAQLRKEEEKTAKLGSRQIEDDEDDIEDIEDIDDTDDSDDIDDDTGDDSEEQDEEQKAED
jgi:translation initiation factor IF-3